ncbi:MAG: polysulfide reductase NrfD [Nitrospiraceae bacterium]|nr:MAG: polysulfide reductase NrfD [Nitrospiraceae bacterium]
MVIMIKNLIIALKLIAKGSRGYYIWLAVLGVFIFIGATSYIQQLRTGLIETAMRDQVSWGFYIANFTFLVGVAAAAVLLVIPAYLYHFKPIKEIVLFGELIAVTAVSMCLMFIIADMGRPERAWHIFPPPFGKMHFPASLLAWDFIVLNGYLGINLFIAFYAMYKVSHGKEYNMKLLLPMILLSIPWAVSIHTVTAFLYNGLSARPFWNASILAPRFLASAFVSGPALMLILFQIIRKISKLEIEDRAVFKIAELMAFAMAINLFLLLAEVFKEFYSGSVHMAPMKYLYFGLHGHTGLVAFMWIALLFNITAFIVLLVPKTRENYFTLNLACVFLIIGVYIEKGAGLVFPGFIPGTLGEIYEYIPTALEMNVTLGIWATGALIYTVLAKIAIPIDTGELRFVSKEMPKPVHPVR